MQSGWEPSYFSPDQRAAMLAFEEGTTYFVPWGEHDRDISKVRVSVNGLLAVGAEIKLSKALKASRSFLGCLAHMTDIGQWASDVRYLDAIPFGRWQTITAHEETAIQFSGGNSGDMVWRIDHNAFARVEDIWFKAPDFVNNSGESDIAG